MESYNIDWKRYEALYGQPDRQLALLNEWIAEHGASPRLLRSKSLALWFMRRPELALVEIQKIFDFDARLDPTEHFLCGVYCFELQSYLKAEEQFRAALRLGDEIGDIWVDELSKLMLAATLVRQGRVDEGQTIARDLPEDCRFWVEERMLSQPEILRFEPDTGA